MSYSHNHVTNNLLQRGFKESRTDLTPMKIQKLLYYLNGWHLAITGKPAIDRPFEAWDYGPVVDPVYHELKKFGAKPVDSYVKEYDPKREKKVAYVISESIEQFKDIFDLTWEKYIGISALTLSTMTHEKGSPWDVTRNSGKDIIADELIRKHFIELTKQ